jgi:hypothetical protein
MWMPFHLDEEEVDPQIPFEIGRIIMRWSRVEEALDSDIQKLSKHPDATLPEDMPVAFRKRIALWHRLVKTAFPTVPLYLAKAQEVHTSAMGLADWRNNLTHGWVTVEHGLVKIVISKWAGKLRTTRVYNDIQSAELTKVADDIKSLEQEIVAFGINYFWLKTHRLKPSQS